MNGKGNRIDAQDTNKEMEWSFQEAPMEPDDSVNYFATDTKLLRS